MCVCVYIMSVCLSARLPASLSLSLSLSSSAQSRESARAPSLRAGAHWVLRPVRNYSADEAGGLRWKSPDPERTK